MFRRFICAFFLIASVTHAIADPIVPERRQIVSQGLDFIGTDLEPLFDTTATGCQTACMSNSACTAYTFNTRNKSCFPKSEVTQTEAYDGAFSAIIRPTDPDVLLNSESRRQDLDFLSEQDVQAIQKRAETIGARHPGGQWELDQMLAAVARDKAKGEHFNAVHWTGAIVALTDTADQWVEYARLSMQIESDRQRHGQQAFEAAANAYLRAPGDAMRVTALLQMAPALERLSRGRDMVRALRLAEAIDPRQDVLEALEDAVGKYGFRITDHQVDNESAAPRICAEFSEGLVKAGVDYTPFVRLPDAGLVVEPQDSQLCIDGVTHGERYSITFRAGLPAASGESLLKDVEITAYVRDRSPQVLFPGRAYMLPKSADAALPVETINLDEVELTLHRVSDRNLLRVIQGEYFGRPIGAYVEEQFSQDLAEEIWTGTGLVPNRLNQSMTTRLPLGDALADHPAGIYTLTARIPGADPYEDDSGATQWFVLSDLGLTTLKGTDGLHVFVRGLQTADSLEGVELTLLSRSNRPLGTLTSDAMGHVLFDPGLLRGKDGAAPAMVLARNGDRDLAFLSLTDPAFDLSDRGVEGHPPAPPVDVFLTTDRGAYRAGEVIHATALARDDKARALTGLPLTAILKRPDGVEYSRVTSTRDSAGGHVFRLPVAGSAPRGSWTLDIKADPDAPVLASQKLLVEDFLPERIDFDLSLPDAPLRPGDPAPLSVDARYLFGAPGAGLRADGFVQIRPKRSLDGFEGYQFGRHDEGGSRQTEFAEGGLTDADGQLTMTLPLPNVTAQDRPYEARFIISTKEGSGRPVERSLTRKLAPAGPMIGIRPETDGVVAEGTQAGFHLIAVDANETLMPMAVTWTLNRVETRYQWYQEYGSWNWEPVTRRSRIATGTAQLGADPVFVAAGVDWGQYELVVERTDGAYVSSSVDFHAGWYAPADATSTPDTLEVALDKPTYRSGDIARLRVVPRYEGMGLVTVMSNRVIDMQAFYLSDAENLIPLEVTDDWGAGAYVTVQMIRPMDVSRGQNPARALGLSYASIGPGDKTLSVAINAPETADPREPLDVSVTVDGLADGDTGYVTLAAVDVGILNLTGFDSPDPEDHYFGQRRLGVEIRDLYGRLIDGLNGAQGQVRSGGDAGVGNRFQSPPPQEDLVAHFTGPIRIDADGTARASFDIPDFNGAVRLMAVAWSDIGVGSAEEEVLIRDPVVMTASLPRFLAPGDDSRLLLELSHVTGPSGRMGLDITAPGLILSGRIPSGIDLSDQAKTVLSLPVRAGEVGDHALRIALTTPDGRQLVKTLTLGVRANDPEIASTRRFSLAPGETLTLDDNLFADLNPGTGSAILSTGALARLNAPGLLSALDRYPYGCTEQVTSRAMPLLYFSEVSEALGLVATQDIQSRIDDAVTQILSRQSSNGGFGLWYAASGDFWLDAYVSDFLSRARDRGFTVPDLAFTTAMDNLRNRINYAPDFDLGGEDIAYALMVLAREGAARMGDLRYYADVKADAFATPMALAQLGSALASYGDQTRADRLFRQAVRRFDAQTEPESQIWRVDYGTRQRDRAAVLALALDAGSQAVDAEAFSTALTGAGPDLSTQEQVWTLLATNALVRDPDLTALSWNGTALDTPVLRLSASEVSTPQAFTNTGTNPTDITLTTFGVPRIAPEAGGFGYGIERRYYDLEGTPVSLEKITTGTRLVAVLTVTPFEHGEARLMVNDPLPAGLEIDNPNVLQAGDIAALDWLDTADPQHSEFRADRFLAAVDWRSDRPFDLAYIVRAVSPGAYHHPAASVEDMYRPRYRARSATGRMQVVPE